MTRLLAAAIAILASGCASAPYRSAPALDAALERGAERLVAEPKGGVLIISNDTGIVLRRRFGAWSEAEGRRAYPVYSVSKSFAAAAALALADRPGSGFSLDDPVAMHLPGAVVDDPTQPIRIRHLLAMTSGLPARFPRDSCVGDRKVTLEMCARSLLELAETHSEGTSPPGAVHEYSAVTWTILAAAMTAAYNRQYGTSLTFSQLLERLLFAPCGWPTPRFIGDAPPASDNVWVGGGLLTDVDTGAHLAELLRSGRCGLERQVRLLSPVTLAALRANQIGGAEIKGSIFAFAPAKRSRTYSFGLFRSDYPGAPQPHLLIGPGLAGSTVFLDPANRYSGFLLLADKEGGLERGDVMLESILNVLTSAQLPVRNFRMR